MTLVVKIMENCNSNCERSSEEFPDAGKAEGCLENFSFVGQFPMFNDDDEEEEVPFYVSKYNQHSIYLPPIDIRKNIWDKFDFDDLNPFVPDYIEGRAEANCLDFDNMEIVFLDNNQSRDYNELLPGVNMDKIFKTASKKRGNSDGTGRSRKKVVIKEDWGKMNEPESTKIENNIPKPKRTYRKKKNW